MNSHISRTSTFSAPVVQSRLEHHHQQQEARQHHQFHQRSKSLNNKGKRGFSYNHQQKIKETNTSSTTENTIYSRNINNKFSSYSNNFDSSYHREQNVGYSNNSNNNNFLVENGSVGQLQRKTSTSNRPSRRHQHSDSVDEDKFRVIPSVSILKRPQSATDFVKSSNSKSISSLDVTQEEQGNHHHRPNKVWEKSPPSQRSQSKERRRSDVTPRSNRPAQRKETRSMEFETDLMPKASTQLSGSGDESDVNSNKYVKLSHNNNTTTTTQSNNAFIFPPLNYSNAIIALEEGMNSNKKEDTYSNSDDNAIAKSSFERFSKKEHYVESTPRRLSGTAIELQSQVSRFAESDSESFLSSLNPSARRPPSSSPGRLGGPKLYAGPTFHNSPAPSDLPIPSFYGKSLGKEPSPFSVNGGNNLFTVPENMLSPPSSVDNYSSPSSGNTSDDDIFAMDDIEPSKVPYYPETPTLRKQKSQELLRILEAADARRHQTAAAYMVPERMATAHNPMQVYPSSDLNELSETLRNLLKIHGQ